MNIFTMLSSSRDSKKITIGNVIKVKQLQNFCLHMKLRVSTSVLFILFLFSISTVNIFITPNI